MAKLWKTVRCWWILIIPSCGRFVFFWPKLVLKWSNQKKTLTPRSKATKEQIPKTQWVGQEINKSSNRKAKNELVICSEYSSPVTMHHFLEIFNAGLRSQPKCRFLLPVFRNSDSSLKNSCHDCKSASKRPRIPVGIRIDAIRPSPTDLLGSHNTHVSELHPSEPLMFFCECSKWLAQTKKGITPKIFKFRPELGGQ